MDRRQGLIGYLAVGLGVLALVVAIGGRWSGPQMRGDSQRRFGAQEEARQPAEAVPAPPPATPLPVAPPQEHGFHQRGTRGDMARGEEQGGEWGGWGDRRGFRRDEHEGFGFLGGIVPLAGAFLLMALGFRLFRGGGRYGGGGRWAGSLGQPRNGGWTGPHSGPPQGNPPQAAPDAAAPPPPHTGETRRFDA